jgi:hypothetical protein
MVGNLGGEVAARYSGVAHSLTHALLDIASVGPSGRPHPHYVGFNRLDAGSVLDLVIMSLGAFMPAVAEQIDAYGWPPSSWRRWSVHIRSVLRRQVAELERGTLQDEFRDIEFD